MKYQAITIDTQTIFDNEMHLHRGLIAQLAQYKGSSVQVVMSEITLREIARKLADKAKAPIETHFGRLFEMVRAMIKSPPNKKAS